MVLKNRHFQDMIGTSSFSRLIQAVVIDEAHCICQWGDGFRPMYAKLGDIRALIPRATPFMALSATLPPPVLAEVKRSLGFNDTALVLNLGNDRPNITHEVREMTGSKNHPLDILSLIPDDVTPSTTLEKTMWFVNTRDACHVHHQLLLKHLPAELHSQVEIYHSLRSKGTKKRILREYSKRNSRIRILICTEAFGMVSGNAYVPWPLS
jgi:superfamily II DNA helicase RecQ